MPSIAIIGAGPAGLTLARLLQQSQLPDLQITIFEKDPSPKSRFHQGGTLDLHPGTALAAIKKAGLWDEVMKYARYEGEEMKFGDKNGMVFVHMKEAPNVEGFEARPEIDRERLKDILLESVEGGTVKVRWGMHLRRVDFEGQDGDGGKLVFDDETVAGPFDLVVGAEGGWSKVRNVVSDVKPMYSGVCGLGGNIDKESAGEDWEKVSKMVSQGSYFNCSDGKALMAQRMGDGSLKLGVWTKREVSWPTDIIERNGGDEQKIRQALLAEFPDWSKSLTLWLKLTNQFQPWPLYELPIGHRWDHKRGWTLIGDSAHLMTPFAGEGVNAAMKDALDLAEAIIEACQKNDTDLDAAVQKFEEQMFPRARKVQEETAFNKIHMFREDAPIGFMVGMLGQAARETGYDLNKGWLRWVPISKTASSYFNVLAWYGRWRKWLREDVFGI